MATITDNESKNKQLAVVQFKVPNTLIQKMEKVNPPPPGHLSIILPSIVFGSIIACITYVLLLLPAYYYVGLFLAIYFAKRIHELFGAKQDKEEAIFIKGQTKASRYTFSSNCNIHKKFVRHLFFYFRPFN